LLFSILSCDPSTAGCVGFDPVRFTVLDLFAKMAQTLHNSVRCAARFPALGRYPSFSTKNPISHVLILSFAHSVEMIVADEKVFHKVRGKKKLSQNNGV
jgi:hypothetical protein